MVECEKKRLVSADNRSKGTAASEVLNEFEKTGGKF